MVKATLKFNSAMNTLRPLLVFGPRKSGTTLLHNLLDGSGELIMIPGELKLQRISRQQLLAPAQQRRRYLHRGRLDFERMMTWRDERPETTTDFAFDGLSVPQTREVFDIDNYVAQLREILEDDGLTTRDIIERDVAAFVGAVRQPSPHLKYWASKEVSSRPKVALGVWKDLFPEGRVVFLVRQPFFVVRAILNDRRRKSITMSVREIISHCVEAQHLVNFAFQLSHEKEEEQAVFVSYEKLTSDTEGEMKRVSRHLGIIFEPILSQPTTLGLPMVVRTSSRATTAVFQQESDWRKGLTAREIRAITIYQKLEPLLFKARREQVVPYVEMQARIQQLAP